jgi:hypothetical protein
MLYLVSLGCVLIPKAKFGIPQREIGGVAAGFGKSTDAISHSHVSHTISEKVSWNNGKNKFQFLKILG